MQLVGSFALLLMSGLLLLSSRPGGSWSGVASARFAAALIMLIQALLSLIPVALPYAVTLLVQQLSLYAALPLLICTLITAAVGLHWSRLIWGRVLLALCVVFEIARRMNELHNWMLIALAGAFIAAVLTITSNKKYAAPAILSWAALIFWFYQTGLAHHDLNLWLAATIVPSLYFHRA